MSVSIFFTLEAELPSGSRLKIQRAGRVWVASFASVQAVVRPGEIPEFVRRGHAWADENLSGLSATLAKLTVTHFGAVIAEIDAAELEAVS